MREAHVRNAISKLSLLCRFIIYGLLMCMYGLGGLRPDEFWHLLLLISPVTAFYFSGLLKFMADHRYQRKGASLAAAFSMLATVGLAGLYGAEMLLIVLKSLQNTFSYDTIFMVIGVIEMLLGAYAGFFMTTLFRISEEGGAD